MSGLRICLSRLSRTSLQVHKRAATSRLLVPTAQITQITPAASIHFATTPTAPAPGMAFVKKIFKGGSGKDKKAEEPAVNGVDETLADQTEALSINEKNGDSELATFALSWFWFPEAQFGCAPGVLKTRVGFTGGKKKAPTYYSLGDHTETVEITFDPKVTSYKEMLKLFWENHDPTRCASRQYMSAIFYHDETQRKLAEESMEARQRQLSRKIVTKITAAETFYNAEDYHQKYLLRQQQDILKSLKLSDADLIISHVACRLNGYCGGYGNMAALEKELPAFKLSTQVQERVRGIVTRGRFH